MQVAQSERERSVSSPSNLVAIITLTNGQLLIYINAMDGPASSQFKPQIFLKASSLCQYLVFPDVRADKLASHS